MRGTGSHTRVTPLGSVTSTFVVTSNVRQPAGAVDAPARRANDGTPRTAPAAGRVIDLRNVRRSIEASLGEARGYRHSSAMQIGGVDILLTSRSASAMKRSGLARDADDRLRDDLTDLPARFAAPGEPFTDAGGAIGSHREQQSARG